MHSKILSFFSTKASKEKIEIKFTEGDVVLSQFGHMFAKQTALNI